MGQWGNRGLLELWVRRTPNRVQRVRRLVGNVLLGNSREELSHRNGEDLTTAIEDNWDGLFLKLRWRHLVLELDPLSVRPVNPTFSLRSWRTLARPHVSCLLMSAYPPTTAKAIISPLPLSPSQASSETDPESLEGTLRNVAFRLLAPENWKIG